MSLLRVGFVLLLSSALLLLTPRVFPQTGDPVVAAQTSASTTPRDPQAISIVASVIKTAGGSAVLDSVDDFIASGTIAYNWGDKDVSGDATVRGKGTNEFRLDATLPEGPRTELVNGDSGSIRESNGDLHSMAYPNVMNFASLTYPYTTLVSALNHPWVSIRYLGVVTNSDRSLYRISVQTIPVGAEPSGMLYRFSRKDFLVDTSTFQIASTFDMVHPDSDFDREFPHEIRFSDYRIVSGILVPFQCEERINGQHTWTLRLADYRFNTKLQDSDFQF